MSAASGISVLSLIYNVAISGSLEMWEEKVGTLSCSYSMLTGCSQTTFSSWQSQSLLSVREIITIGVYVH